MRYNPIPDTDEDLTDYRGSIVHLTPGTTYEIELTLAGTPRHATSRPRPGAKISPWRNGPRPRPRQPLAITQSGTPEAYRRL